MVELWNDLPPKSLPLSAAQRLVTLNSDEGRVVTIDAQSEESGSVIATRVKANVPARGKVSGVANSRIAKAATQT